jgi:hypothetical protein
VEQNASFVESLTTAVQVTNEGAFPGPTATPGWAKGKYKVAERVSNHTNKLRHGKGARYCTLDHEITDCINSKTFNDIPEQFFIAAINETTRNVIFIGATEKWTQICSSNPPRKGITLETYTEKRV